MTSILREKFSAPLVVLAVLAVAVIGAAAALDPAPTSAWCNPGRTHDNVSYFDGRILSGVPGTYVYGVRSVLEEYDVYVYPAAGQRTSAWVMLASQGGASQYAQIGWKDLAGGQRHVFIQYRQGAQFVDILRAPSNDFTFYDLQYSFGKFIFRANGQWMHEDWATFTPVRALAMGETHTHASQMPGGFVNTMAFAAREAYYNHAWRPMGGAMSVTDNYWHGQYQGGFNAMETWDRACAN